MVNFGEFVLKHQEAIIIAMWEDEGTGGHHRFKKALFDAMDASRQYGATKAQEKAYEACKEGPCETILGK